ncbi:HRDC domain-containing protein [Daejeonella lutea]|uniref:Helix-turn-helix domain-containing protein n=1 Tax=Daejeonella lutea TaxID=572036 RepID=A0A1T5EJ10_9SPHI|nr:HRDC domain-containing protein [Daejeonella lutea]SKB83887.1 Helix-turn-helix domain-containing protein [Daejeonella lutea]
MEQNAQLELAFNFVQFTDRNIFLTGKAGTGKTTFLHHLKKSSPKRMTVVAPTGVAAINAGGVTINSFFQLPFGPYIPGTTNKNGQHKRFSKDKINLIRSLDLLVIDEISMVRADTLDHIDEVMRRYRNHHKPFGGVQLLMIGDLHQLSPVVKDEDWMMLKSFYPNMFFFSSQALSQTKPVSIELKHIYRQADTKFISLLNSVRQNEIDQGVLNKLNERYIPNFNPADDEGYIILTTHNKTAQDINETKLAQIEKPAKFFSARIQDDFPEYSYPTVPELELKKGAQIMFVKNDSSRERLYYNGKIGVVTNITDELIYVKCPGEYSEIAVSPVEWTNIKYVLDPLTKEVQEKVIGTFTQYPLKLAWAITIHKSQGLTFEKAIIDANLAFAHGQVYVALSRCKSFEGMVLRSPIAFNSVKTDGTVAEYTRNSNEPSEADLNDAKIEFQQDLLYELFDFTSIKAFLYQLRKVFEDHHTILNPQFQTVLDNIKATADKEVFEIGETFKRQIRSLLGENSLPEDNSELQIRVKKASAYFNEKINSALKGSLPGLNTDTDNKSVKSTLSDIMDGLSKEINVKLALMKLCSGGFSTSSYLKTKADTEIDQSSANPSFQPKAALSKNITHPELYQRLKEWRDELAEEKNMPVYLVLAQKSILELVEILPSSLGELETIKGIGKMKVKQFGPEILEIINSYCRENDIERSEIILPVKDKPAKIDSKKVSLALFQSGKTVAEIASDRALTTGTIESHLANFITSGEISVFDIVSKIKVARIMAHIVQNPGKTTSETKMELGETISYGDLKAVMNHLKYIQTQGF